MTFRDHSLRFKMSHVTDREDTRPNRSRAQILATYLADVVRLHVVGYRALHGGHRSQKKGVVDRARGISGILRYRMRGTPEFTCICPGLGVKVAQLHRHDMALELVCEADRRSESS